MDEYIKREDALDAVLFALCGTGYQSRAIDAIRELPTADAVPKSELHDDHHKQVACYTLGCREGDKIRREVARGIFEEIYKSVASKIPMQIRPIFKGDLGFDAGFINGKRDALIEVLALIAELKKKYTEENTKK